MTAFAYALAGQIVSSVHARINLDLYLHLEQQKQTNNRAILELLSLMPEQTLQRQRQPVRHLLNLTLIVHTLDLIDSAVYWLFFLQPLNPGSFLPAHPAVFLKMPALPLSVKFPVAVTVAIECGIYEILYKANI
jgi:hypothetical protein